MVLLHQRTTGRGRIGFGTMSFQMVLLRATPLLYPRKRFGTMSFQMVLLHEQRTNHPQRSFGTMSFQMVLLPPPFATRTASVLELCHSRWFYYRPRKSSQWSMFWNYVIPDGSTTATIRSTYTKVFWNYVIPDGSTTYLPDIKPISMFWNYVIPDGSTTSPAT